MKKSLLIALILIIYANGVYAENGYKLWLRYKPIQKEVIKSGYEKYCLNISQISQGNIIASGIDELLSGISGMLGKKPNISSEFKSNSLIVGRFNELKHGLAKSFSGTIKEINNEGYLIHTVGSNILITGKTDVGVLYGVFHFLRLMQMHENIANLKIVESPDIKLRLLNHWDNPGKGTVARGYAGKSIFKWEELPKIEQRYIDYARMLASIGINGTVVNNVNTAKNGLEGWKLLTSEYLPKLKALAGVLRNYGVKLYISVNFFSPVLISGLETADPLDPEVQEWWDKKVAGIYKEIPDFGGFLVKADSEGEPGPLKYDRTHAEGANLLASSLKPYGGIVMWRSFVYGIKDIDRAAQSYRMFKPLDGKFAENAILQIKNGPIDFQVREPVNPLFGAMPKTNQMLEVQITQEYTGHATHICYLVPQWKKVLDFDTYAKGKGSTVNKIIDGSLFDYSYSGIAGVSNIGDDTNWTGHLLAQANAYGFGRLAWNPKLTAEEITDEWIKLTFGNDAKVREVVSGILLSSWKTYENYTSPLGVGFMCDGRVHYYPSPSTRENYHRADKKGVGYDRTNATGSGFTYQYFDPVRAVYERLETCPEELLLFFHHVPYTYKLKSGKTIIQHIYDTHNSGVEQVKVYKEQWNTLKGLIDQERFNHVLKKMEQQIIDAAVWRDSINAYFFNLSGIEDTSKQNTIDIIK